MKIGLLVDGRAEYQALSLLVSRLSTAHTVLHQPLLCDIQPFASPQQMALAASKKFPRSKDYDKVTGAMAICKKLDPDRAAANSRSFRKLLKTLGQG